jgi:hypothetical protein
VGSVHDDDVRSMLSKKLMPLPVANFTSSKLHIIRSLRTTSSSQSLVPSLTRETCVHPLLRYEIVVDHQHWDEEANKRFTRDPLGSHTPRKYRATQLMIRRGGI